MNSYIISKDLCTGCATCVGLCPTSALKMKKVISEGIYLPQKDDKKCIDCKKCIEVCPGRSMNLELLTEDIFDKNISKDDFFIGRYINNYIGFSCDPEIRFSSSSGGIVTQILVFALENGIIDGALVTRMKRDSPLEPESFIARTREEIVEASKSKYCPVPANISLKDILESKDNEKFAVVGLPCHLQGIRRAERINKKLKNKIVLHIGIFCAMTKNFLATELLLEYFKIKKEEIQKIDYRGLGWPGSMNIKLIGDRERNFYLSEYGLNRNFLYLVPRRCMLCNDATAELSDISCADAWLPEIKKNDKLGTSIIISRTLKSEYMINLMLRDDVIKVGIIDLDQVKESQDNFKWKKINLKARINISRVIGKNIPDLEGYPCTNPSYYAYLEGGLFFLKRYLVSKRNLWWFLDCYESFTKYLKINQR